MERRAVEEALFRAFVVPHRRHRYLALLESTKGRQQLRRQLAHFSDVDRRFTRAIPPNQQTPERIEQLLTTLGAPNQCLVVSEAAELDGVQMPLRLALDRTVGEGWGTLLSCLAGKLAYYEGEGPSDRCILLRDRQLTHRHF